MREIICKSANERTEAQKQYVLDLFNRRARLIKSSCTIEQNENESQLFEILATIKDCESEKFYYFAVDLDFRYETAKFSVSFDQLAQDSDYLTFSAHAIEIALAAVVEFFSEETASTH